MTLFVGPHSSLTGFVCDFEWSDFEQVPGHQRPSAWMWRIWASTGPSSLACWPPWSSLTSLQYSNPTQQMAHCLQTCLGLSCSHTFVLLVPHIKCLVYPISASSDGVYFPGDPTLSERLCVFCVVKARSVLTCSLSQWPWERGSVYSCLSCHIGS